MHDHNPDLVAGLAEGTLGKPEARSAQAEISACPRCAADLAAQRRSLEATRVLQGATMTSSERTDLRAAIAAAINLDIDVVPQAEPKRSRRVIPWPSIAVAALSVVAVIAIVPLIGTLSTSGSDDAASSAEFALTTVTDANQRIESAAPNEDSLSGVASADDGQGLDAESLPVAGGSDATASSSPTTAAATTTPDPPTTAVPPILERIGETELKAITDQGPDLIARSTPAEGPCTAEAVGSFDGDAEVLTAPIDVDGGQTRAIAYFVTSDGATIDQLLVLTADTCEVVGQFG